LRKREHQHRAIRGMILANIKKEKEGDEETGGKGSDTVKGTTFA